MGGVCHFSICISIKGAYVEEVRMCPTLSFTSALIAISSGQGLPPVRPFVSAVASMISRPFLR